MDLTNDIAQARTFAEPYRVIDGSNFTLANHAPGDTGEVSDRKQAKSILKRSIKVMSELQEMLYAQNRWALLLVFQAMDAAGKDSAIKHVMSGVNPQGCQVFSFKAPSAEELDHDYLWRCVQRLPERGRIGVFNRSYYEEVLVVRVHPEILEGQRIPRSLVTDSIWEERLQDICNLEQYLARNGVAICKFFLNVSKEEQLQRFLNRLNEPEKHWKFSERDVRERAIWGQYMRAYEEAIRRTASEQSPWYVIPADHKWYTRVVVSSAIIETMASLDLHYPVVSEERRAELAQAREELLIEANLDGAS